MKYATRAENDPVDGPQQAPANGHLRPGLRDRFSHFRSAVLHALSKRQELDLNQLEVFDTYTSIIESGFMSALGVLCAIGAAVLPVNTADEWVSLLSDPNRDDGYWHPPRKCPAKLEAIAAEQPPTLRETLLKSQHFLSG